MMEQCCMVTGDSQGCEWSIPAGFTEPSKGVGRFALWGPRPKLAGSPRHMGLFRSTHMGSPVTPRQVSGALPLVPWCHPGGSPEHQCEDLGLTQGGVWNTTNRSLGPPRWVSRAPPKDPLIQMGCGLRELTSPKRVSGITWGVCLSVTAGSQRTT